MASFEMKDMTGALFKNDKGENQNRPDLKGKIMVDGKLLYLSAWKKKSAAGDAYYSISVQKPQAHTGDNEPEPNF